MICTQICAKWLMPFTGNHLTTSLSRKSPPPSFKASKYTRPRNHTRTWPTLSSKHRHCLQLNCDLWNHHHLAVTPHLCNRLLYGSEKGSRKTLSKQNHRLPRLVAPVWSHLFVDKIKQRWQLWSLLPLNSQTRANYPWVWFFHRYQAMQSKSVLTSHI